MTETRLFYNTATNTSSTVPPGLHDYAVKATPVDADELPLSDSATGWSYRRLSWANLKLAVGVYYNTLTATMTNKTLTNPVLTSPRINIIYDTNAAIALGVGGTASAVNYLTIPNAAAGSAPTLAAWGADASVSINFKPKGNGGFKFLISNNNELVSITPNVTDPTGNIGRLSITNSPQSADSPTMTITSHGGGGKPNSNLNLVAEGTGTVGVNGRPVVTGSPAGNALTPLSLWAGTRAQYDAIATKSPATIYVVTTAAAVTGDITSGEGASTGVITSEEPVAVEPN